MTDTPKIAAKRQQVRELYSRYGVGSVEYETAFAELHDMNMKHMANQYRSARGLPSRARTPYCG